MTNPESTAGGSAPQGRLTGAIYTLGLLLFLGWIASRLFSSTVLVSGVPFFWRLPVVVMCALMGAALGYALPAGKWRLSSAAAKKTATLLSMSIFAFLYGAIGNNLAEQAANFVVFAGKSVESRIAVQPVRVVGIGRGAKRYVELKDLGDIRFGISRLDFGILAASAREPTSLRYCLPVVIERAGEVIRVRLRNVSRPSVSGRAGAIVECKSGIPAPTLIS